MALDFLTQLGNYAGPISNIINAIRGPQKVQQLPVPPGEAYATSLYKALAEPNNSLVASMTAANQQQGMNDLQQQLTEQQLADRREVSMGRAPTYFDPERADQTVSYLTSRGAPGIAANARTQAINQIQAAAQGAGGFAGAQGQRTSNYMAAQGASKEAQLQNPSLTPFGRINTGTQGLEQILQMFAKQQGMENTGQVKWNQPVDPSMYGPYQNPNVMRYTQ